MSPLDLGVRSKVYTSQRIASLRLLAEGRDPALSVPQRNQSEADLDCDQQDDDDFEKFAACRLRLIGKEAVHLVDGGDLRIDLLLPIFEPEAAGGTAVEARIIGVADDFQRVRRAIGELGDVDDEITQ